MKNKFKNSFICILSINLFFGCVNDTYDTPQFSDCVDPGLTKTKEVAQIYSVAVNPVPDAITGIPNTPIYTADDIIEAYVISSDEGGNFYKSMYFQPLDGSKGFNLSIDESNLYAKNYQPGKKVFLKLKGLAFGNPNNRFARGLVFGAPPTDQYDVNRIPPLSYPKHLNATCETANEDDIVNKITLAQALSGTNYLNTLVEIDNVQFTGEALGEAYDSNRKDEYDSSIYVTDGVKNVTIRTSRYANFASRKVPSGKGKIKGVLTRYNTTYQIILRTERDLDMPNPRIDYHLPIGGSSVEYPSSLTENFESYPTSSTSSDFPQYINDAHKGGKYWNVNSYSSNKYIQMSAFNSGGTNTAYLVIPITFTPNKKLSFKTKGGFYNGEVLKVYYSKDYILREDISKAILVNISSHFSISKGTETGYASSFTPSGNYSIPKNITGNGFIIFEYNTAGRAEVTSSIQIDDIMVN